MIITKEPFQTLEYKEYNEGVGIAEKNKIDGEWISKIILMNRTQALKLAVEIFKTYKRRV